VASRWNYLAPYISSVKLSEDKGYGLFFNRVSYKGKKFITLKSGGYSRWLRQRWRWQDSRWGLTLKFATFSWNHFKSIIKWKKDLSWLKTKWLLHQSTIQPTGVITVWASWHLSNWHSINWYLTNWHILFHQILAIVISFFNDWHPIKEVLLKYSSEDKILALFFIITFCYNSSFCCRNKWIKI